jgi:salicylate hydroxylase
MSADLPVIIGAGISGLAFAQGLLKAGIRFRIYERDPALNARSQGYRFRIHGSGQAALAALLPPDLYSYLKASCAITPPGGIIAGGSFDALRDPSLGEIPGPYGANPPRPEVVNGGVGEPWNADRGVMRSVLMSHLGRFVNFGREFVGYDITDSGVRVQFRDGGRWKEDLWWRRRNWVAGAATSDTRLHFSRYRGTSSVWEDTVYPRV